MRILRAVLVSIAAFLAAAVHPAAAQVNTLGWSAAGLFNKTVAVGAMDSTAIVDMSGQRNLTLRVKINPAAGVAEPWAIIGIRAIGSANSAPDSNSVGILQLTPVADHSYSGAAQGDTLAYGAWVTGTATSPGNGIMLVGGRRPNSSFPYPHAWWFALNSKGQGAPTRYVYFQVFTYASGSASAPRIEITTEKSN